MSKGSTPKAKGGRRTRRQTKIVGTEQVDIDELDEIGAELEEADNQRNAWKNDCTRLRGAMATAMEKHKRTMYEYGTKTFLYEAGNPKLKIKTKKEDEDE